MSIICAVFLLLALIVPGHVHPHIPWSTIFAIIWFIVFVLEKQGMSRWGA